MDGGLVDHVSPVFQLALRLTQDVHRAEDLTQETFLRAWQRCHQIKDRKAIRTWLFRIAVNLARDEFRRQKSSLPHSNDLMENLNCPDPPPDAVAESNDELNYSARLLDSLPTRQRMVLFLVAVQDLSLADVCRVLDINMNTAKVNLCLARKRMREELEKRRGATR